MDSSPLVPIDVERALRVLLEPVLELADRDQASTPTTDHAQLMHDVFLQEVDADTKGVGRLALGKRQTSERSHVSSLALFLNRLTQDAHGPLSCDPLFSRPRAVPSSIARDSFGTVVARIRRS